MYDDEPKSRRQFLREMKHIAFGAVTGAGVGAAVGPKLRHMGAKQAARQNGQPVPPPDGVSLERDVMPGAILGAVAVTAHKVEKRRRASIRENKAPYRYDEDEQRIDIINRAIEEQNRDRER